MNNKHKQGCACFVCDQVNAGVSIEEARANSIFWQDEAIKMHGWYVHYIGDDDVPTGCNSHTHGLVDKYFHLDLQIVCPLPPKVAHGTFWNIVNRIAGGEKFKNGDIVEDIAGNGYKVKFVNAWEDDRPVLRVIIPDKDHNLDRDTLTGNFKLQYKDLDPEYVQ